MPWAEDAASQLLALGFRAVVLKGGHLSGRAVDVVADGKGVRRLDGPRLAHRKARGTGCRFASALAAGLAQREPLDRAALAAKRAVARYLRITA